MAMTNYKPLLYINSTLWPHCTVSVEVLEKQIILLGNGDYTLTKNKLLYKFNTGPILLFVVWCLRNR